jgi:serine protease Do
MIPKNVLRRSVMALFCLLSVAAATAKEKDEADILAKKNFVRSNCFEVVILKNETDSLTYEKPLDFDLLDYADRMDKYIAIGTAFPIDADHLVTAAHVLMLNDKSSVYPQRFVRIKETIDGKETEKVYEVDMVTAYSNHRDYAVFTAKGLKLKNWFETESKITFNEKIYTAGNAFGEGIIIRDGVLLSEYPETENNEWSYLKSSVATNPGNSGGPLLNKDFKVIGIVLQKKDDFCYSLALKDIIPGKMLYHKKNFFSLSGLNARIKRSSDFEMPLPANYLKVIDYSDAKYTELYMKYMDELIAENSKTFFPNGEVSLQALYNSNLSVFPQAYLQDSNDNNWFISKLETTKSDIGGNGTVQWSETYKDSGVWYMTIKAPEGTKPSEYTDNPKLMMDTILKGINIKRQLNKQDAGTRIVSNGAPIESADYRDRYGRNWKINVWTMEFMDKAIITFSLPTPTGVALIYKSIATSAKTLWMYDLKKQCDFTVVSFTGTVPEWKAFLSGPSSRYEGLADLRFAYEEGKSIQLSNAEFNATVDSNMFPINEKNEIYVNMSVYQKDGKPYFGIRRVLFDEGGENGTFCLFFKWVKPDSRLDKDYQDDWNQNVGKRIHPYTKTPYTADGRSSIASMHPSFYDTKTGEPNKPYCYSLFISKPGTVDVENMVDALNHLESEITFK